MYCYSAKWLRYEAELTYKYLSIRILSYEKQKDFKKDFKISFCYLEKKKILAQGGFLKKLND
jgi:hypothetical protein